MFAKLNGVTGTSVGLTITVRFIYEDPMRLIITSIFFAKLKISLNYYFLLLSCRFHICNIRNNHHIPVYQLSKFGTLHLLFFLSKIF